MEEDVGEMSAGVLADLFGTGKSQRAIICEVVYDEEDVATPTLRNRRERRTTPTKTGAVVGNRM